MFISAHQWFKIPRLARIRFPRHSPSMNLRPIINTIANQADDFLDGVTDRKEARAGIDEFITIEYSKLGAEDRKTVGDHVMAVLEDENFFNGGYAGHSFDDENEAPEE